jgi:hypothetical protein
MKNIILTQFTIGEEFALHEFELDYLETKLDKNGIELDFYRYRGNLDNLGVKEVVLAYNCDVLRGVFTMARM